jgi:hypothetical protein
MPAPPGAAGDGNTHADQGDSAGMVQGVLELFLMFIQRVSGGQTSEVRDQKSDIKTGGFLTSYF